MGRIIPYILENKKYVWNHQPDRYVDLSVEHRDTLNVYGLFSNKLPKFVLL